MDACYNDGGLDKLKMFMKNCTDIQARENYGSTILHIASRNSNQEVEEFLLKLNKKCVNATNNLNRTPLIKACYDGGRLDNIKMLILNGTDIQARESYGSKELHFMSQLSNQEIVEFLLTLNEISVNATGNLNQTPVLNARYDGGRFDNVKMFMQNSADIPARENYGSTILHFASRNSNQDIVEFLLKLNEISVHATDNLNQTSVTNASYDGGLLDNIKMLIQNGADIQANSTNGSTVLHFASQFSKQEVEFLLKLNEIFVNATDNLNRTPLTYACYDSGRLHNIETLILNGTDIQARDSYDSKVLHFASRNPNQEVVEFLLKVNEIAPNATDNVNRTPLMKARYEDGSLDNIKIQNGADIQAPDSYGSTASYFATQFSNKEVVEFLLKLNEISVNATDNLNQTPLLRACYGGGCFDNIKILIQNGVDIRASSSTGSTVLQFVSRNSNQEIVEFLLKLNEISVNATDNLNRTPLMDACHYSGRLDNIKMLTQNGADIQAPNSYGSTILYFVSPFSNQEVIEFLLKLNYSSVNATYNLNQTSVIKACYDGGRLNNIKILIQNGADIQVRGSTGSTVLHFASRYSNQEVVEFLWKLNEICVNTTDNLNRTPIHCAWYDGGRLDNIKMLPQNCADIQASSGTGSTVLYFAFQFSNQEVVEFLLKLNEISVNAADNLNRIPLIDACYDGGRLNNTKTLIQNGADIQARDSYGSKVLHLASRNSNQEVVEFLLKLTEIALNLTDNLNRTPLIKACYDDGSLDNIKMLIQNGADIQAPDSYSSSALYFASQFSNQEKVEFLLKLSEIFVNATDNLNQTPLLRACYGGGCFGNIKILIQNGADIQVSGSTGSTVLHFASRHSNQEVVEFLLKLNEISVNATDNYNQTPVVCACFDGGRLDNIKMLIQNGADIQASSSNGSTVLHFASRYSNQEVVEFLLKLNEISVNATDNYNRTPLMKACYDGGRLDNIKKLIRNGADIQASSSNGSTVLHFASRYSNQEVVEFLLKLNEIFVNATDNLNRTPLMEACYDGGRLDNIKMLIQNGADIQARDCDGSTVLHFASRNSNQEVLEFLLKLNEISVNATDNLNRTPLMDACHDGGRLDNVKMLIQNGADIQARDCDGSTVLHFVSRHSNQEVVEFLLKLNEISVNATDNYNQTPVVCACFDGGRLDNIKMLIQNGADIQASSSDGSTVLHFASRYSNQEVVEFLLKLNEISVNATDNLNQTPLMKACYDGGRLDNIKMLIQNDADIQASSSNGSTLLHFASQFSTQKVLEFLLKLNEIAVNATENLNRTPLMYACFYSGRLDNIKMLMQNGADIQARDCDGSTVLHFASRNSNQEVVEFLLKLNEISVNATDNLNQTPVLFACFDGGRLDNMKMLIQNGADIQASSSNGSTVLHFASRYSNHEVLEFLLKLNEISANATDNLNRTPLMNACFDGGRLDNIKMLLQNGADIQARDCDGSTVLHFASRNSNQEVVEFLLKLNEIFVNTTDNFKQTPFMDACYDGGRFDNIKMLIQNGADIQASSSDGLTVLHFASRYSNHEVLEFLLKLNEISVNATDNLNRTPLMNACFDGGRLDNIKMLLQNGADIQARDCDGSTVLHFASRNSNQEVVEFLLKLNEIFVNTTDNFKQTPFMDACYDGGRFDNIKMLIQNGADIQASSSDGLTVLHFASRYSNHEVLEFLLKLNEISVNATDNLNRTPLMNACFDGGRLDNIKMLLQSGADIQARDCDGSTVLHFASRNSNQEVVEFLLKLNEIFVNTTDNFKQTPFMDACYDGGRFDNIKMLIQNGADIQASSSDGLTVLHFASQFSNQEIVEFLLKLNEIFVNATDNLNRTPLMYACLYSGRLDNVKMLMQNGADIQARDCDGSTVLHYASRNSNQEVVEFLLKLNEISVNATDNYNQTPVMCACFDGGSLDNIKMLIQNGADIQASSSNGSTVLHFATCYSNHEVVEFLLKLNEISVNATDNLNRTPLLHACCDSVRLDNIKMLIQNGADIQARDCDGSTILHFASRYSNQEVVEFLLKLNEICVNATDNFNQTPLMDACFDGGRLDNIKMLIQYGGDIRARSSNGSTILHFASRYSNQEVVEFLLKLNEICVNATDNFNQTPLMDACFDGGRLDNIKMLIQYGGDIRARSSNGSTVLHYASRNSNQEVVEFLLKLNEISVNATDNFNRTPLMYACYDSGRLGNLQALMINGADIHVKAMPEKWNVFHYACAVSKLDVVKCLINIYALHMNVSVADFSISSAKLWPNYIQLLSCLYENDFKNMLSLCELSSLKNVGACEICKEKLGPLIHEADDMGMTPFMTACERNRVDIVSFLIECGITVNANISQKQRPIALHVAARYASIDLLEILLNNDVAVINAADEFGFTPLFWACQSNRLDVVKYLVSRGACVNIKTQGNWNLLHMAAVCADNDMIEYLLAHKVSLNDVDNQNRTPLSLAYEIKREDTIKFLLLNGALLRPIDFSFVRSALYETAAVNGNIETQSMRFCNSGNFTFRENINTKYNNCFLASFS